MYRCSLFCYTPPPPPPSLSKEYLGNFYLGRKKERLEVGFPNMFLQNISMRKLLCNSTTITKTTSAWRVLAQKIPFTWQKTFMDLKSCIWIGNRFEGGWVAATLFLGNHFSLPAPVFQEETPPKCRKQCNDDDNAF